VYFHNTLNLVSWRAIGYFVGGVASFAEVFVTVLVSAHLPFSVVHEESNDGLKI